MAKTKRAKRSKVPGSPRAGGGGGGGARAERSRAAKLMVRGAPVVIALACIAVWFATKSGQLVAVVASGGAIVWLAVALGTLGAQVRPRDNGRAGAIDFGKRN